MKCVLVALSLCALAGCSLVNDPARHVGGGLDAGPLEEDAGADADAGPDAGTDAGSLDGGPGISTARACGAIAEVACRGYFSCCPTAPPDPASADVTACHMAVRRECEIGGQAAIDEPASGYNPHLAETLLGEGLELAQNCDNGFFDWYRRRDGVFRAMEGTIAQGAMCHEGAFPSIPSIFSCAGGPEARCVKGDTDQWTCQLPIAIAELCSAGVECDDGLHCPLAFPSRCIRTADDGEPCGTDYDCASLICGSATPRVCIARASDAAFCSLYEP